jgi:hypothetical protein
MKVACGKSDMCVAPPMDKMCPKPPISAAPVNNLELRASGRVGLLVNRGLPFVVRIKVLMA